MREIVIISGVRTPVGRYLGALRDVEAYDLAALVLNEAIRRAGVEADVVDEVVLGQSYQSGEYVNIARMALLKAGWPEEIPGVTIDRRCCTGLDVVKMAGAMIQAGQAEIVVAGGVESMSRAEFYLPGTIKWGVGGAGGMPRGHGDLSIWGLPFYDRIQRARVMSQPIERFGVLPSMMSWAETAAKEEEISREACDQWALESHQKACAAMDEGKFDEEIISVTIPQRKGDPITFDRDETPRRDTSMEKLSRLRPVLGGVCTAGNSSSENDGAAAVVVTHADKAKELAVRNKERTRSEAEVVLDDAAKAVSEAKDALGAVSGALSKAGRVHPRKKAGEFRSLLDSLRSSADGMGRDLEGARTAYNRGAYKDALTGAKEVLGRAEALKDELMSLKDRIAEARPLPWYERLKRKRLEELRRKGS